MREETPGEPDDDERALLGLPSSKVPTATAV
jgi:hypothetical protein